MTPRQLRAIRSNLGLTQEALSRIVRHDLSTIRRWEARTNVKSHRKIPGSAAVLFEELAAGNLPHLLGRAKK